MSKFVKLLTSAYVNGLLRHPHEGVLHLEDAEADRLVESEAAEEVTDDFSAAQRKETPVEGLRAAPDNTDAAQLEPVEHQANVAPATGDDAAAKPKKETTK